MSGVPRAGIVHVHSDYSRDGRDPLERLRGFALERGIRFIGLTDHAEDFEPELFEEYRDHCESLSDGEVRLIPGLEFRFVGHTGLHLLVFGLRQWIVARTPGELVRLARPVAGLTAVAHPVLARYRIPQDVLDLVDAVEVWNATYNTRYLPDPRAIGVFHQIRRRRPEVVALAGLDQHDCRNDRETRVLLTEDATDHLAELRAGRFVNVGRTLRFDPAVSWSPARLRALTAARWMFDRVENLHDAVLHAVGQTRGVRG